jgi:type VI secretion system protein ImpA
LSSDDVKAMLEPISADAPCGEDLSYDPSYAALLTEAEGTPERQTGDSIIPAQEPHWPSIRKGAIEQFGRSKDLRLGMLFMLSGLAIDGLPGMRRGLQLVSGLLGTYWSECYPRLDPEDNNDPIERVNIVSALTMPPATFGDTAKFQERIAAVPLCASAQLGRFSLRHMRLASGDQQPNPGESAPDQSMIEAVLTDTPLETLQATRDDALACIDGLKAIDDAFVANVGPGVGPSLGGVRSVFAEIVKRLDAHLGARTESAMGVSDQGDPNSSGGAGGAANAGGGQAISGTIRSSEDVRRALEMICQYYERHEPSSPIPILLRRAQRLVSRSFLDIIRDMSPEALDKLSTISGENLTGEGS